MSERTPFAGLEVLSPSDPLSKDSFALQFSNPKLIDHLLKLGAITHKHDGGVAMPAPVTAPTVANNPVGGSIPALETIKVGYTLIDPSGGETLVSPLKSITTPEGIKSPGKAPSAAVSYVAGALLANNYTYGVTVTDGKGGETTISPVANAVVEPGHEHAEVKVGLLKKILEETAGTEWRLWRRQGGGEWDLLAKGAAEEIVDDGSLAPDCTVSPPASSTVHSTNKLEITVPHQETEATFFRLYATNGGEFGAQNLIAEHPIAALGEVLTVTALALAPGAPPLTSQAYGHANKINADTDVTHMHWKASVKKVSELPTEGNETGDVRVALETLHLYLWEEGTWHDISLKTMYSTHDFVLRGGVTLEPPIPGHSVGLAANEKQQLVKVRYSIKTGTSVSFRVQRNGEDIPGLGTAEIPLLAKTEAKTATAAQELAEWDDIAPLLSAQAGENTGLKVSLVIAHIF